MEEVTPGDSRRDCISNKGVLEEGQGAPGGGTGDRGELALLQLATAGGLQRAAECSTRSKLVVLSGAYSDPVCQGHFAIFLLSNPPEMGGTGGSAIRGPHRPISPVLRLKAFNMNGRGLQRGLQYLLAHLRFFHVRSEPKLISTVRCDEDLGVGELGLQLSLSICRLQSRPECAGFSTSSGISFLFLPPVETDPSFPSSSHVPGTPTSPPPGTGAARRAPSPPGYCSSPAGTRLPIPYMDKCVQANAQGTARETAGRGWGGRRGRAPTSSRSRPAEVSLFVCGFAPGPRSSFPGISSISSGKSRPLQGTQGQKVTSQLALRLSLFTIPSSDGGCFPSADSGTGKCSYSSGSLVPLSAIDKEHKQLTGDLLELL
ncbi:hypothetical protein HispidOSU_015059 [Sigmodon hispidus]